MKKSMTKIVAQNYLLPNTRKLLAQCLGIPILVNRLNPGRVKPQKYTWIETYAGIRIGKIKHGKYNIYTLHNVLYPIFIKMIEPSIIYKPSQFMLFSDINPISLIVDPILSNNKAINMGVIYDNTILFNYDCIRIIKCETHNSCTFAYIKSRAIMDVYNMFNIYLHRDNTDRSRYIKIRYDKFGLKHTYTRDVEYNLDLIKDLFGYEMYDRVVKYYNSYIYNHLHGIKNDISTIQSKLSKLYNAIKTGVLKDDGRRIDISYIKYNLRKILSIQQMCYDRLSAFKSINKDFYANIYPYPYNEPIPLIFVI